MTKAKFQEALVFFGIDERELPEETAADEVYSRVIKAVQDVIKDIISSDLSIGDKLACIDKVRSSAAAGVIV